MDFKIGMQIHDIFKRCWYQITRIYDDRHIWLVGNDNSIRTTTQEELEKIYKASPLNKREETRK